MSGTCDNGTAPKVLLAKTTAAGTIDPTFGTSGLSLTTFNTLTTSATTTYVSSEATQQTTQSNGNTIVCGTMTSSASIDFGLLRISQQGAADISFGTSGLQTLDFGSNDAAQSVISTGSAVYVVGKAYNGSNYDFAIAKYYQ